MFKCLPVSSVGDQQAVGLGSCRARPGRVFELLSFGHHVTSSQTTVAVADAEIVNFLGRFCPLEPYPKRLVRYQHMAIKGSKKWEAAFGRVEPDPLLRL